MNIAPRRPLARTMGLILVLATTLALGNALAPRAVTADTGGTNKVKVIPATTTISPVGTGGTFSVGVAANGSVDISGASAGLSFDSAKLTLTALAKNATVVANGGGYGGFPSTTGMAAFIAAANTGGAHPGQIPNIGYFYTDGTFDTANTNITIWTATFKVKAVGNSTLVPNAAPAMLDGRPGTYGIPLLPLGVVNGSVVNAILSATMTALASWLATNTVPVKWTGKPGAFPVANYDVRYRRAAWNGTFGTYTTWLSATTLTQSSFTTSPGYTYCFSVRARDTHANVSAFSAETCTAAPLDDRSLTRTSAWTAKTGSAYYRSTFVQATKLGAKLTRTSIKAKRIALLVTTCATCGSVKVYLGTTLLKSISLASSTTVNKKLITVIAWTTVKSGTLSIKVSTSGKKVIIDGVVLSAR